MARSARNEKASRTTESAAAAVGLSLSMFEKICTDATCVLNGMFPEMRMTAPNSPTARAKASATPERIAGTRFGKDHAAEDREAAGAERGRSLLHLPIELVHDGLHRADDEGQRDEEERGDDRRSACTRC